MPLERHITAYADQVEVLASMDVGTMWDRMLGEFLGKWSDLDRQGVSEAEMYSELNSWMNDLSTKPEEKLARQSSEVSYNQGRAAEIETAHEERGVDWVLRSEILDTETCGTCYDLDGTTYRVDLPEFERYMPPQFCEGGKNCRGFYVAIGPGSGA